MNRDDETNGDQSASGGVRARVTDLWRRARRRWWSRWAIDLAIFGLLFAAITWYQSRDLVDTGEQIPETRLQSATGDIEPLVDPDAGRTLVYVWAPWCGVCTAQSGTVEWARSVLGDGVAVRSVVFDWKSAEHARRSARDKGLEAPVLLADRTVAEALNVGAFPTFYVLSREGRVLGHSRGYTTTLGLLWRAWF